MLSQKKQKNNKVIINKFIKLVNDQQAFLDTMHKVSSRRARPQNSITAEDGLFSVLQNETDS